MGASCLFAAFFFGSYLHNRPAQDQKNQPEIVSADPLDSIFSFGKRSADTAPVSAPPIQRNTAPAIPAFSAIEPSERAPVMAAFTDPIQEQPAVQEQSKQPTFVPAATRKPVVPDFSELASRFRNTPLELSEPSQAEPRSNAVYDSERVPFSGQFEAPEMVVRQPKNIQPFQDFTAEVDRVEEAVRGEFSAVQPVQPETTRWRVNRTKALETFRRTDQVPRQDFGNQDFGNQQFGQQNFGRQDARSRETIEDVLSRRSADYLLENDESSRETWATNPPQDSWTSRQRRKVTEQAAMRSGNILEIEDPGNRFRSSVGGADQVSPPEPDFEKAYYEPSNQRQDSVPPRAIRQMQPIRGNVSSNWGRQSNIESQFGNTYRAQPGDTLQSISMRFYGSAEYYLEIYKANREVLDRITSSLDGVEIEIPNLNN